MSEELRQTDWIDPAFEYDPREEVDDEKGKDNPNEAPE